jgi:rhodanese-related sulfurtransferase
MSEIMNAVEAAQEIATEISPAPVNFDRITSAQALKARLDWGEPALTIIDVRDREPSNEQRIQGAIHCASDDVVERVQQTLEPERDIYIYADDEGVAINAASQLDRAGFQKVAVLEGGLKAWQSIAGAVEGRAA